MIRFSGSIAMEDVPQTYLKVTSKTLAAAALVLAAGTVVDGFRELREG